MNERVIESDFTDAERLEIAIERLKYIEEQYLALGTDEDASDQLNEDYRDAAGELADLLHGRTLAITGNMKCAKIDEYGHVVGHEMATGTLEECRLRAIEVLAEEAGDWFPRGTIVLRVIYGRIMYNTDTEETDIKYKAMLPLSSCSVSMADELEDFIDSIQPEWNDEFAEEVNTLLMNESLDLQGLSELVLQSFPGFSELQREMYLNHIQSVGAMPGYDVGVSAGHMEIYDGNYGEDGVAVTGDCSAYGEFAGYTIEEVEDDEGKTQYLLGVLVLSREEQMVSAVYVQDITDIIFTRQVVTQ